jgi:hypothetical protein
VPANQDVERGSKQESQLTNPPEKSLMNCSAGALIKLVDRVALLGFSGTRPISGVGEEPELITGPATWLEE